MKDILFNYDANVYKNNTQSDERKQDAAYQAFLAWKAAPRDLTSTRYVVSELSMLHQDKCEAQGTPKFCAVLARMLVRAYHEQRVQDNNTPEYTAPLEKPGP